MAIERHAADDSCGARAPGSVSQVLPDMRGGGERLASAVPRTEEAHLVLLARLPTRLSAQIIVGRVAEHRQARLVQTRRLPDGCRWSARDDREVQLHPKRS